MILGLVVCLFVATSFAKELIRSYQINRDIESLKRNITQLQGQNERMADFVEYLKTDAYFEQQARLKLNLKRAGEKEIVLKNPAQDVAAHAGDIAPPLVSATRAQDDQQSNPSKWVHFFFGT